MKQTIRFNETDLHRLIKESVKEVIEAYQEVLANDYKLGSKATKLYNKLDA